MVLVSGAKRRGKNHRMGSNDGMDHGNDNNGYGYNNDDDDHNDANPNDNI